MTTLVIGTTRIQVSELHVRNIGLVEQKDHSYMPGAKWYAFYTAGTREALEPGESTVCIWKPKGNRV